MFVCRFGTSLRFVVLAALSTLNVAPTLAANVLHRYTFNDGTANDSVGAAHGVVFVPNNPAFAATFNAGRLDLRANAGGGPLAIIGNTQGAFVELPDGLFTGAANAGTSGAVSVEAWVNIAQNRQNSRIWSFGESLPEGANPYWGQFTEWVDLNGQNNGGNLALTTHQLTQGFNVNELQRPGVLPTGALHHLVATFDQNDIQGGVDGTMRLYVNNVQVGTGFAISTGLAIGAFNDVNNFLGRSQWGDSLFDGQIDEVAVYDAALTLAEVAQRFSAGPAPTPIPTFVINRATGDVSVENHTPVNFRLKSYTISSVAGGFNAAAWESIADTGDANSGNMGFDPVNIWTEQAGSAVQLAEGTTGNGGLLTATTGSRSLGDAWIRTPFQDLTATFVLSDGSTGTADITYTGPTIGRSDLNGDGALNVADWSVFLAGTNKSFAGQTRVASFLGGDINGDFVNDFRDFRLFQLDYIAANGAVAFAALTGIPEPATAALGLVGLFALARTRARRVSMLMLLCVVGVGGLGGGLAGAATPATYIASGDPGGFPDANGQIDDVWTTTPTGTGGSGSGFFPAGGIPGGDHWVLFSYPLGGVNGVIQADHAFVGGALSVGQSVRINFANRAIAAGGSVGVSLTSGGSPVVTFKYNGEDPLGVYRFDDAGGVDQNTGEPFAYETFANLEISLETATTYRAAVGFGATWTGTLSAGPIDGFSVFNNGGGDASDVAFDNFVIGPTTLVPLSLEVNKSSGMVKIKGNPTLLANIDYYEIASAQNALDPGSWNSLDQQNLFAVDGADPDSVAGNSLSEGWDRSPSSATSQLTEYFLRSGGAPVPVGGELLLGAAYNPAVFGAMDGDLQLAYGVAGGARLMGSVTYVSSGAIQGDYNISGAVEGGDFGIWKTGFGSAVAAGTGADGSSNGRVDGQDFLIWQRRFGATAGPAQAVPEQSTFSLLFVVLGTGGMLRRCLTVQM